MNVWHRFTHWMMSDMLTLEERELIAEQARRLRLRTDLQEARIKERQARRLQYRPVGVWKKRHIRHFNSGVKISCTASFFLEERSDGKMRRVIAGSIVNNDNGTVVQAAELEAFFTNEPVYQKYIVQWLHGQLTTDELRDRDEGITITLPKRRRK